MYRSSSPSSHQATRARRPAAGSSGLAAGRSAATASSSMPFNSASRCCPSSARRKSRTTSCKVKPGLGQRLRHQGELGQPVAHLRGLQVIQASSGPPQPGHQANGIVSSSANTPSSANRSASRRSSRLVLAPIVARTARARSCGWPTSSPRPISPRRSSTTAGPPARSRSSSTAPARTHPGPSARSQPGSC